MTELYYTSMQQALEEIDRLKATIKDLIDAWDQFSETDDVFVMDEAVERALGDKIEDIDTNGAMGRLEI